MEKKKYVKPSMEVFQLNQPTKLLVGSENPGYTGYIPGMGDDEKHLA